MDWLDRLDRDEGWNPIIDELAWHLREGRWPVAVVALPQGVEFRFAHASPQFHHMAAGSFAEHWRDAVRAIETVPALGTIQLVDPA